MYVAYLRGKYIFVSVFIHFSLLVHIFQWVSEVHFYKKNIEFWFLGFLFVVVLTLVQ